MPAAGEFGAALDSMMAAVMMAPGSANTPMPNTEIKAAQMRPNAVTGVMSP